MATALLVYFFAWSPRPNYLTPNSKKKSYKISPNSPAGKAQNPKWGKETEKAPKGIFQIRCLFCYHFVKFKRFWRSFFLVFFFAQNVKYFFHYFRLVVWNVIFWKKTTVVMVLLFHLELTGNFLRIFFRVF